VHWKHLLTSPLTPSPEGKGAYGVVQTQLLPSPSEPKRASGRGVGGEVPSTHCLSARTVGGGAALLPGA
jgi:hypothetical protein